jgi:uroporphyrin-3 C-methyltransferase
MTDKPEADITSASKKSDDVNNDQQMLDELREQVRESQTKESASSAPNKTEEKKTTKDNSKSRTPHPDKTSVKPAKTTVLWLFTVFNLILILGVAGAGYWFWQKIDRQIDNQNQQTQSGITSQFSAQQQRLDNALTQLVEQLNDNTSDALKPVFDQLNSVSLKADATQARISEISGRRPSDWLLAEADYLVRMAGRKLWLEKDATTAVLMLQTADQRLADINDPSLIPLRELVANDIVNVQQVNQVPTTAIALKITGLIKSVDSLPLSMVTLPDAEDSVVNEDLTGSVSDWRANLYRSWRKVADDFVTVRRRTDSIQPLMSAQQQWLTREKLKHYLLQSQTALLSGDQILFTEFLSLAKEGLLLFESENYRVTTFNQDLETLLETKIKQDFPLRLNAQLALEDALKARTSGIVPVSQSKPL